MINPYESPRTASDPPERRVELAVRVFRILGMFGLLYAVPVVIVLGVGVIFGVINFEGAIVWMLVMPALHIGVIFASREYLRVASLLPDNPVLIKQARLLSWLMMLGFPIFTVGYLVLPVMIAIGAMCVNQLREKQMQLDQGVDGASRP